MLAFTEGPRGEWQEIMGVADVPPGAGKLVVLLLVQGQESAEDTAWFDEAGVYRL